MVFSLRATGRNCQRRRRRPDIIRSDAEKLRADVTIQQAGARHRYRQTDGEQRQRLPHHPGGAYRNALCSRPF